MSGDLTVIDLRAGDLPARSMTIPGSTPDVWLARLHVDERTKANVALVRFPAGWARPGVGYYGCDEQFVVLGGDLEVSGVRYTAGHFGYLPARAARAESRSPSGCLAVAYFSRPPVWSAGPSPTGADEPTMHGRLTALDRRTDVGGGAYGRDDVPAGPVDITTELIWPEPGLWCLVPIGATPPALPGPVIVREWP